MVAWRVGGGASPAFPSSRLWAQADGWLGLVGGGGTATCFNHTTHTYRPVGFVPLQREDGRLQGAPGAAGQAAGSGHERAGGRVPQAQLAVLAATCHAHFCWPLASRATRTYAGRLPACGLYQIPTSLASLPPARPPSGAHQRHVAPDDGGGHVQPATRAGAVHTGVCGLLPACQLWWVQGGGAALHSLPPVHVT